MSNPFAIFILIVVVFCYFKKRNVAYLGFPEDDLLKKSRILRVGLPILAALISLAALLHAAIYFYIPLLG